RQLAGGVREVPAAGARALEAGDLHRRHPGELMSGTPRVRRMRVVPVAGQDGMLLNLSGAHGPYFTRNVVLLEDDAGHVGLGEVPGGEKIRRTLEDAIPLVAGQPLSHRNGILQAMRAAFADRDAGGRG